MESLGLLILLVLDKLCKNQFGLMGLDKAHSRVWAHMVLLASQTDSRALRDRYNKPQPWDLRLTRTCKATLTLRLLVLVLLTTRLCIRITLNRSLNSNTSTKTNPNLTHSPNHL